METVIIIIFFDMFTFYIWENSESDQKFDYNFAILDQFAYIFLVPWWIFLIFGTESPELILFFHPLLRNQLYCGLVSLNQILGIPI